MITAIIENCSYPLNKMVIFRHESELHKYVIASVKMHVNDAQRIADAINKDQNPMMVLETSPAAERADIIISKIDLKLLELDLKQYKELASDRYNMIKHVENNFQDFIKINHENLKEELEGFKGKLNEVTSMNTNLVEQSGKLQQIILKLKTMILDTKHELVDMLRPQTDDLHAKDVADKLEIRMKESGLF